MITGADLHDPADRFSSLISRILGWEEINLGKPEAQLVGRHSDGRIEDPTSGAARVADVLKAQPDVAVIMFGDEDHAGSRLVGERRIGLGRDSMAYVPVARQERRLVRRASSTSTRRVTAVQEIPARPIIGTFTRGAVASPGTFAGDYDHILSEIGSIIPGDRIYVVTPPYRPDALRPNDVGLTLQDYCQTARAVARQREVRYVDLFGESTIQPASFDTVSDDGSLLNARGHQHVAAFLIERLLK